MNFITGMSSNQATIVWAVSLAIFLSLSGGMLLHLITRDTKGSLGWAMLSLVCSLCLPFTSTVIYEDMAKEEKQFEGSKREFAELISERRVGSGKTSYYMLKLKRAGSLQQTIEVAFYKCGGDWPENSRLFEIEVAHSGGIRFPSCANDLVTTLFNLRTWWWAYAFAIALSLLWLGAALRNNYVSRSE